MQDVLLAVNGTLMRGMATESVMTEAGARFVREDRTAPVYRLWSIDDRHPAMLRVSEGGASIAVEVYALTPQSFVSVLSEEPEGLSIGRVTLADGASVFGVLGEPVLCEGQREITALGGWRAYLESLG